MAQTYKSMTIRERQIKSKCDEKITKLRQQIYHLKRKLRQKDNIIKALSRSDVEVRDE